MNLSEEWLSGARQSLHCSKCGGWLILTSSDLRREIDGIRVNARGLPVLHCPDCTSDYLPDRTKKAILFHVQEAIRRESPAVNFERMADALDRRFTFCPHAAFLYDALDFDYLPGLMRPWDEGFLTPVFFKKSDLIKYFNHPDYVVELGSGSYGAIYCNQELLISFGINRNDKLIMWLGDLDKLEAAEQYYLRSENVPSDHDIGSDFYLGQIEAVFTDPSNEHRLFQARMAFGEKCAKDYCLKLHQYDDEVIGIMARIHRPVTAAEQEISGVIQSLNKVIVEALNIQGLKQAITTTAPDTDVNKLGGLKLLQKWVGLTYPALDAAKILCPFFVLYDFRIAVAHLVPAESAQSTLASCFERMGMTYLGASPRGIYAVSTKTGLAVLGARFVATVCRSSPDSARTF